MTAVRDLRPTDLVALAAFETKATPNQARTRERLTRESKGPLFLNALVEPWLPTESRRTVVAGDGLAIRGLASARQRRRSTAWEVDWLVVDDSAEGPDNASGLLEQLAARCAELGALRIFLRVPHGSNCLDAARRSGFWPYLAESMFVRDAGEVAQPVDPPDGLRQREKVDELALFRLYSQVVPSSVRSAEGMTLEDWRASQESTPGRRREYVVTRDDSVEGWLWVARSGGSNHLSIIATHDDEQTVNGLIRFALAQCDRRDPAVALVPSFQSGLRFALRADWAFEEVAHFQTLIKHLPVRVSQPAFVPARA